MALLFFPSIRTILLLALLSCSLAARLDAHREYVHQYLAIEAFRLLSQRHPGLAASEMASHIGTQSGDCGGFQFTDGTVAAGAYREDCEDPVFRYGDIAGALDDAYFSASHFWDADAGDASTIQICDVTCSQYRNAYQKGLRYILPGIYGRWTAKLTWPAGVASFNLRGGGTGSIFHNGLIGFEYDSLAPFYRHGACTITGFMDINGRWQTAATVPDRLPMRIIAPAAVRDRIAWEVVGRLAHLLGDMGVPAHAHNDIHPPFWWNNEPADVFEEEMARTYAAWSHEDAIAQGGLLDFRGAVTPGSDERVLRYLLYTTNQVADRFPSNDGDGDAVYDASWAGDDYSVLRIIDGITTPPGARNQFHREAGDAAFVFSIRSIAGLLDWFAQETGILARVTVDADFPGATVLVDGKPRTAPHLMTGAAGAQFTIEARDQAVPDGTSGSTLTMRFEAWDRLLPSGAASRFTERVLTGSAVDGLKYTARFDTIAGLTLTPAMHLDGGSGGRYSVNGADVGNSWSSPVNISAVPAFTVAFTPPAGSVFLRWSDGERANPRELRPSGNTTLGALCKRRLVTTVPPASRPGNQRRIALTGATASNGVVAVMVYESAGDVYYAESVDGVRWGDEMLVSDGRGNARDPAVEWFIDPEDGDPGSLVVWEDRNRGGTGHRILTRQRRGHPAGWTGIVALHADKQAADIRATPVASGDIVAWRSSAGILVGRLSGMGPSRVPGTGSSSAGAVIDAFAPSEGRFGIAWIEGDASVHFARGAYPGPGWTSPVTVAAAGAGTTTRVDVAIAGTGAGCVAWMTASGGDRTIRYRTFDQADFFQPPTLFNGCPLRGSAEPVFGMTHHRPDPDAPKDLGIHAWDPGTAGLVSVTLRASMRSGPSVLRLTGSHPELPRAAAGTVPVLVSTPRDAASWTIGGASVSLAATLPAAPAPEAPSPGASNVASSVQLSWACAPDASAYAVQVGRDLSFSAPLVADVAQPTGSSFALAGLLPATTYHWRVRSFNSLGGGGYSQARTFTTASPPPAPSLSGAVVATAKGNVPRLTWTAATGAESYSLSRYVCADPDDCGIQAARPTLVYEGPLTSFTDAGVAVGPKSAGGMAHYFVTARRAGFAGPRSNTVGFPVQAEVVWSDRAALPETNGLGDNYPNPFNPVTTIPFRLAVPGFVTITAYNLLAQRVATVVEGHHAAGFHETAWDASALPAGVYILTMEVRGSGTGSGVIDRRKVVVLK